jgi:hypothetical protein
MRRQSACEEDRRNDQGVGRGVAIDHGSVEYGGSP